MPQSLPEIADIQQGAEILMLRIKIARQARGMAKSAADWTDAVNKGVNSVMTAKPDVSSAFGPGGGGASQYWKNTGLESLRNAAIGAGVGGVGGLASSLFSKRRRKNPLKRGLRGALLGAALGGGGTALYRGGQYATSDKPDAAAKLKAGDEQLLEAQKKRQEAQDEARSDLEQGGLLQGVRNAPWTADRGFSRMLEWFGGDKGAQEPTKIVGNMAKDVYGEDAGWGAGAMAGAGAVSPWVLGGIRRRFNLLPDVSRYLSSGKTEGIPANLPKKGLGLRQYRSERAPFTTGKGIPAGSAPAPEVVDALATRDRFTGTRVLRSIAPGRFGFNNRITGMSGPQASNLSRMANPPMTKKRKGALGLFLGGGTAALGTWLERARKQQQQ